MNSQAQREMFKNQLLQSVPKGVEVTDAMMDMMMSMGSLVDSIPLIINSKANGWIGVNMYVDDKGTAKGLPGNQRASGIAMWSGQMLDVRGDAFIGRVLDDDDRFERMDF